MIEQECIGIPDMILLLMIFFVSKKIKIKAEIVLSPGGAYFVQYLIFCSSRKVILISRTLLFSDAFLQLIIFYFWPWIIFEQFMELFLQSSLCGSPRKGFDSFIISL